MARRRVNTKFLGASFIGLVAVAGGGYVFQHYFRHHDPAPFIRAGDMFAKQGEWMQAAANYGQAAALSPRNAELMTKLGGAQMKLRTVDRDQVQAAVVSWNRATEIDPNYLPAWKDLLSIFLEELHGADATHRATAGYFAHAREVASQCVRLDPKDISLSGVPLELDIWTWLDNIPLPATTGAEAAMSDSQRADQAIAALSKISTGDSQFPFWVALAKVRQGEDALHGNQPDVAYAKFDEASKAYDASIAQRPKDTALYLGQFDALGDLIAMDNRPDARAAYDKKRRDGFEKAQSTIDVADPLYPAVRTKYAAMIAPKDPVKAEGIYRDLIAKFPTNYGVRVDLATLLATQPKRMDDALSVLAQLPDQPPVTAVGNARLLMESQLADGRIVHARIESTKLPQAANSADRDKLNALIDADIAAVPARFLDWRRLADIGRVQLVQGKVRDSIQSLEHASEKLKTEDPNRREVSLMLSQAEAYRAGGQISQAISLCEQAMADPAVAAMPASHARLAQLYLSQNDKTGAAVQVDWLKARYPYDVQVIGLEIASLDKTKDQDQINQLYSGLPETDDAAVLKKAEIAQQIGNANETQRLLNRLYNSHPGDARLAFDLARADLVTGKIDDARQVVKESLKVHPDVTSLKLLDEQLNNASPAVRDATVRKGFDSIKDPVAREQQLALYADQTGKPAEALEHLKKAYALSPKSGQIAGDLFSHYLNAKDFKDAEPLLQPLQDMDADQAHGLVYRFNFSFAKGDVPTSLTIGNQLIHDFPEFSGSWSNLGQALEAAGQTSDAASKYLAALQRQGTNYIALRHLVSCCYQLNKIADAQQYIAQGRQRFPNDGAFRELEIEHMLNYGDPEDAVAIVTKTLQTSPDDRNSYITAAQVVSQAAAIVRAKGNSDTADQNLQQARDVLKQAVDKWPDDPTFVVPYASALNATGDFTGGVSAIQTFGAKPAWKDRPDMPLALAHYYQASGHSDQASAPLRDALRLSHDAIPIRNELIGNLINLQKFDDALAELNAEPKSAEVEKQRTQILLEANRPADAEVAARTATAAYPNEEAFLNLLGLALQRQNKLDEARNVIKGALAADSENTGAHYVRAMLDIQNHPPAAEEATHDLQFVLTREPGNSAAAIALADLQVSAGEVDSASHVLETALRASPSNKDMRLKLVELYSRATPPRWDDATRVIELGMTYGSYKNDPDLYRADAMVWARRDRTDNALASIRMALKLAPNRPDLVHDYFGILLSTHNDAQLLDESQAVINNPPVPWWAYADRGSAMAHTGDAAGAAGQFDLALTAAATTNNPATIDSVISSMVKDIGPDKSLELVLPRAQNSLTWKLESVSLLSRFGDRSQAMAMLDQVMSALGNLPPAAQIGTLQMAGSLYLGSNPPAVDKAIAAYKKLLELQPDNAMALNNLAYLLSEMKQPPQPGEALVYSQRAFDNLRTQGRVEPLIYDTQGWVLILDGRVDDGIDVLHQIIDKAPFPDAHYHLAEGYLRKQMAVDAQRELLTADDLIDQAKSKNIAVDPSLKAKVTAALKDAQQMQDAKTQSK